MFAQTMANIGWSASGSSSSSSSSSDGISSSGPASEAEAGQLPPIVDLVVHSMSYPPGAAAPASSSSSLGGASSLCSAAALAGATAATLRAKELVLWQRQAAFADSPEGQDDDFPEEMLQEARAALCGEHVSLGGDYWCHLPERDPEVTPWTADVEE